MKNLLLMLSAAALLGHSAAGQVASATTRPTSAATSARPTADEQFFTKLIEQVGAAIEKRDMTALGQFMIPEYVHYNPGNGSGGRAEELAYVGTWTSTTVKLLSPVKVNHYGNTAITVATSNFSGVAEGKQFSNTIQMMIAWVLRDGRWQMAVIQSKLLPA